MSITFKNVDYEIESYVAFSQLYFSLQSGKKMIVYYKSGDGATLLCKLACGLISPTAGNVLVNGKTVCPKTSGISFLPKEQLFFENKTVLSNLLWAAKLAESNESKSKALLLIAKYGLSQSQKPKAMQRLDRLKLALARSELFNKKIVIADDIFFGLAQQDKIVAEKLFSSFAKGKTVLMTSQDTIFAPKGFEKFCLCFGKIYSVPRNLQDAKVFRAMQIAYPLQNYVFAKIEKNGAGLVARTVEKDFSLTKAQMVEVEKRNVDEIILVLNDENKIICAFDEMDEQKIW